MKVLGLETSTHRGSVALVDAGVLVAHVVHEEPNRHAERMLGLVERALLEANWQRGELERIAVGVGPGAFTGIRVGISLALGLSLGLSVPTVGVGSLGAIALGHDPSDPRLRVVLRDARREEYFLGIYDAAGREQMSPRAVARTALAQTVVELVGDRDFVVLGQEFPGLPWEHGCHDQPPDALAVALIGAQLDPARSPASPRYLRGSGAERPQLAPSPLRLPRS